MGRKILHISKYKDGGAGIAAYNIHKSILAHSGIESFFLSQDEYREISLNNKKIKSLNIFLPFLSWLHQKISNLPILFFAPKLRGRSCNLLPTRWHKLANNGEYNAVVVHWVGGGGLSMTDLCKIKIPVLWVLHDMWIFSGTEHVVTDKRYSDGYKKTKLFIDIDRMFWKVKRKRLKNMSAKISFIAPSMWMYRCARDSKMLEGFDVSMIHNPIDVAFWRGDSGSYNQPIKPITSSRLTITFGATSLSYLKGAQLFVQALQKLNRTMQLDNVFINYVGKLDKDIISHTPYNYHNYGFVDIKEDLRNIYRKSSLCVFPSYIESFGQMAAEAALTGTPVIIYKHTGAADFIVHGYNGTLFDYYNSDSLAVAIKASLKMKSRNNLSAYDFCKAYRSITMQSVSDEYQKLIIDIVKE